ncbi:hypothetical protein [Microbacterium kunmingense]|uniref:hypothetical protein n=1 Tax=Microbacterium kunmingense TaxID=2915939 RepID=UPI0020064474|nr:hypothetical protein [Microbacterium kunmingense]
MSTQPVSAADIRENVKESLQQLIRLQEQGRVVMTQDSYNTDWPDATTALDAAIGSLDHALNAMTWMETLPHLDGGYPPLSE